MDRHQLGNFLSIYDKTEILSIIKRIHDQLISTTMVYVSSRITDSNHDKYTFREKMYDDYTHIDYDDRYVVFHIESLQIYNILKVYYSINNTPGIIHSIERYPGIMDVNDTIISCWIAFIPQTVEIMGKLSNTLEMNRYILRNMFQMMYDSDDRLVSSSNSIRQMLFVLDRLK